MALNAKWAWVADTQGFALLLLLCQRAADGRRTESSFGKAELLWSCCDGLSSSGLCWAGAGPRTKSLMGTYKLGLRWDGVPLRPPASWGSTTPAALLADRLLFLASKPLWSQEEPVILFHLRAWLALKVAQLQNIMCNANVPQVHPRTVDILGQALPTAPSDDNLHWDTHKEGQKKWRSEHHHCLDA